MTPSNFILTALQNLLAGDAATLAPAVGGVRVHLAKAAFAPSPALTLASLTEADFPGYASLVAGTGTQQTFVDPVTGIRVIQILEPAGGWTWESTAAPVPDQTIFGWYVTDNAVTQIYGSALLPTPLVINGIGLGVTVPNVDYRMPATALG